MARRQEVITLATSMMSLRNKEMIKSKRRKARELKLRMSWTDTCSILSASITMIKLKSMPEI
jgi:hypothetical protein